MDPIKESNVSFEYKDSPTHPDMMQVTATLSLYYQTEIPKRSGAEYRERTEQELRARLEHWIWGTVREAANQARLLAFSLLPFGFPFAQQQSLNRMFKRITDHGFVTRKTCANCGLKLRRLNEAEDIPVHEIDGQRACENAAHTMAEWSVG